MIQKKNIIENEDFVQSAFKEGNKKMDNPEILAKKKKGKRKSKNSTNSILVNNSRNKDDKNTISLDENKTLNQKNIQIQEDNNNISSNIRKLSLDQKDKSFEDTTSVIENISINKFFIIFAFCCIKKRKDVNSYMLEEGNRIIKERLDVLNIFKKIFYEEQLQEHFRNTKNYINMSDTCKQKLD